MSVPPPPDLDEEDGRTLLELARAALRAHFRKADAPDPVRPVSDRLAAAAGVFVTLHLDGALRGCVGSLDGRSPLHEAVGAAAVAAAIADPRFKPLSPDEMEHITLDVTVLGDAVDVGDPAAIRIGRHGLIVADGMRRGLLLPQVAEEQGWDALAFLAATCRKAGLEPQAWRSKARVLAFEARVFREPARAGSF